MEAQQKELEIRIAEEKLAKPKVSADFVKFWLTNFRKLDPNVKSHRETLINTFVNAVYLYDEKVLIAFNYKDGTKTITFDEIAAKDAPEGNGSDLGCFAPPRTPVSEPGTGVSVLSALQKGMQGWIRTASTRRTVRRVKKPLRGFFRCAARVKSTRAHQTRKIRTCFRLEKGSDFSFSSGVIAIRIFNS